MMKPVWQVNKGPKRITQINGGRNIVAVPTSEKVSQLLRGTIQVLNLLLEHFNLPLTVHSLSCIRDGL